MKKTAYLLIVAVLVLAAPVFAQGPFNDVPTDHWAYDAVNKLQKDGIIIGYPDGTFGGKRAMSRYEFATAIARILPLLNPGVDLANYVTKDELRDAIAAIKIPEIDLSKYATKADVDAIRKLVDEFRDEIAALGVDVDALKRDVAALCARVDALEAEVKRVRFTGDVNVFAIATSTQKGTPFDLDERETNNVPTGAGAVKRDTLIRNIGVVQDFDLNVVGRVSQTTTARATINYGNYLNYIAFVDDYVDGPRPTTKGGSAAINGNFLKSTLSDTFFPYYLYIATGIGKGAFEVGRFPLQFTPYTLKKIDVDSYTSILKTDDGNYPVDGIKAGYNFGGVDLTLFAVKNNENDFLVNGLTGLPTSGLNDPLNTKAGYLIPFFQDNPGFFGFGHSVGLLDDLITQTAGGRLTFGTPWKGIVGLTYYQAWSEPLWSAAAPTYDQARVYGGDIAIPFGKFGLAGSWTKSDTLAADTAVGVADNTDDNTAWDAKVNAAFGKLGVAAGYKQIDRNFAAAGAWDKIGRWTNPTDIKGPYLDITYPIARKLKVALNGEFLTLMHGMNPLPGLWGKKDDTIIKAEAGLQWGISKSNSLDLGAEWIQFNPDNDALDSAQESYITIGWAHQVTPSAGLKIGYQFINYDDGGTHSGPYGVPGAGGNFDYKGGLGVVQFGVSF